MEYQELTFNIYKNCFNINKNLKYWSCLALTKILHVNNCMEKLNNIKVKEKI
jgi:hypothetical protein